MPSLELMLAISEADLLDWLEQEVDRKLVQVRRQGSDSYHVMLVMDTPDDSSTTQRSIRMRGECDKYRTGHSSEFLDGTWDLSGQVIVQLVPLGECSTRVLIDYDGDPLLRARVELLRGELQALDARVVTDIVTEPAEASTIQPTQENPPVQVPRTRRGPLGTPEDERLKIVQEWLDAQGGTKQNAFCQLQDISSSTLRRWLRDFGERGLLSE